MQLFLASPLLSLVALSNAVNLRTAPDVSAKVQQEAQETIAIHDSFMNQEQEDTQREQEVKRSKSMVALQMDSNFFQPGNWVVALDKDMKTKMLVQIGANTSLPDLKDPCANIKCAAPLSCPAGFKATAVPGHCCPYCMNPEIKLEGEVTGATGKAGGKASTFCPKVWCFPTMCTKGLAQANSANGQCCSICPAL